MMKKIMKILSMCCLASILYVCISNCIYGKDIQEKSSFVGTKEVTYELMTSDINNYCVGGRSALEYALIQILPNNVDYKIVQSRYTIELTIIVSFTTFEEYAKVHNDLLGTEALMYYSDTDELALVESFDAKALLGSLNKYLSEYKVCSEVDFSWLTTVKEHKLSVNDKEYLFEDRVRISNDKVAFDKELFFKSLSLEISKSDDEYVAYVEVQKDRKLSESEVSEQYKEYVLNYAEYVNVNIDYNQGDTYKFELRDVDLQAIFTKLRNCTEICAGWQEFNEEVSENDTKRCHSLYIADYGKLTEEASISMIYKPNKMDDSMEAGNENTEIRMDSITSSGSSILKFYSDLTAEQEAELESQKTANGTEAVEENSGSIITLIRIVSIVIGAVILIGYIVFLIKTLKKKDKEEKE